jgi:general secretion pathway protein B
VSFILDALRKSENERQRGAVPGIVHVPFATPRQRLPTWALAVIVMLGASVVVLGGSWWQSTRSERAGAEPGGSRVAPATDVPIAIPPQSAPSERLAAEPLPPAAIGGTNVPLANVALGRGADASPLPPAEGPPLSGRAAVEATGPATAPEAAGARPTLPSAAALAAEGVAVPALRLELHVYHRDRPADRLVIVNGNRYREGEPLAEGPRVVTIDPTGVVLSYQGREFLLSPE